VSNKSTPNLSDLADKWPSPYVARNEVAKFSGGILTPKYLANLDSAGKGPAGRIRIGRKIAYPTTSLVRWLESRSQLADVVRYKEERKIETRGD
jgi:hypothetical protein